MASRKVGIALWMMVALILARAAVADTAAKGEGDNLITGLEVQPGAGFTRVVLHGQKVPTFTVFKLLSPDRLVVDLIRTELQGVGNPQNVDDPRILQIGTTQFRQAGNVVSRFMIGLKPGVHFDARAEGNDVIVTVSSKDAVVPTSPLAEKNAPDPAPPEPRAAPAVEAPANPGPATGAREEAGTSPAPEVIAAPAAAGQNQDFRVVETQGDKEKAKRVVVQRVVPGKDGAITVLTSGEVGAYEVLEVYNPFRLVVDIYGGTMTAKTHESALSGKYASRVRLARHDDKVRLVLDWPAGPSQGYRIERVKRGLKIDFNQAKSAPLAAKATTAKAAESEKIASGVKPPAGDNPPAAPAPKPAAAPSAKEPVPAPAVAAVSPVSTLKDLTFRQESNEARVILELQGEVAPQVVHTDERSAVLEIPRCQMPVMLERTLDTSEFGSALQSLSAYRVQGEDKVKLVAVTSNRLSSRLERRDGKLNWVFEAPIRKSETEASATVVPPPTESTEYNYAPDEVAGYSVRRPDLAEGTGGGGKGRAKYHGRRISLDFKDIDIHNVLRLISDVAKLNIITSDEVTGKITLTLRNVPWDQALDIILKTKHLGMQEHGNIIRVAKQDELIKEQEDAAKIAEKLKPLEPLRVRIVSINYAHAGDVVAQIKDVLSERGTIAVDQRTNVLIIKDVLENLVKAEGLIRSLDTETPQVLIEARIVEANTQYVRSVGVQWGGTLSFSPATGNPTGLPFPNSTVINGGADDTSTNKDESGTGNPGKFAVNLPAAVGAGSGGAVGFLFGAASGAARLNLRLSALENKGAVKIISAPKIATLDNNKAKIGQGVSIPISVVSAAGVNTMFVEAKLELEVTPHITQEGSILMKIKVAKNEPDFSRTGARGDPTILKKEAETEVMVHDGDTTVIGGIYTRKSSDTRNGIPVLSNIPILGWFFRQTTYDDERTELLIFITPRIVNRLQSTVTQK